MWAHGTSVLLTMFVMRDVARRMRLRAADEVYVYMAWAASRRRGCPRVAAAAFASSSSGGWTACALSCRLTQSRLPPSPRLGGGDSLPMTGSLGRTGSRTTPQET